MRLASVTFRPITEPLIAGRDMLCKPDILTKFTCDDKPLTYIVDLIIKIGQSHIYKARFSPKLDKLYDIIWFINGDIYQKQ